MCFRPKDIFQLEEIMKKLREQKSISKKDYEFLVKINYPAKQLQLEEYVSH